jgi:hypothetical protein
MLQIRFLSSVCVQDVTVIATNIKGFLTNMIFNFIDDVETI